MLPSGTVTFLFTDIEGSTSRWEKMPEAMHASLARHNEILETTIEENSGQVFKTVGDEYQAVFSFPDQALLAAVKAQQILAKTTWGLTGPIKVRMGIHTGPAKASTNDYETSHTLNRVSRVMSAGAGGQILLSLEAAEMMRRSLPEDIYLSDLGEYRLKGMSYYERLYQVNAPDLPKAFPKLEAKKVRPNNLPAQLTSFIGREQDIQLITEKLHDPDIRLLTLTGIGGVGKTRISLQVGQKLLEAFANGVFFVSLASVRDDTLVLPTIAETFGIEETAEQDSLELLKNYLSTKKMLLILDNFEHILPSAPRIASLLGASPDLKILVTSRSLLRLSFEHNYPISPLSLPEVENPNDIDNMASSEALQLFIERAKSVKPDFQPRDENIHALAEICRRLEGVPLALELAAAHARFLSIQQIRTALTTRLGLLKGGPGDLPARHQTMRAAIEWSYQLLSKGEQTIFQQVSIFAGGCTLEALEFVSGREIPFIFGTLTSLVDKNLIRHIDSEGDSRFLMYETIREYGIEQLNETGDQIDLYRQYALFYIGLAHRSAQNPRILDREINNLRAILRWSIDSNNSQMGFRLTGDNFFWSNRVTEGRRWIAELLALPQKPHQIHRRGYTLFTAIILAIYQGDVIDARARIEELNSLAVGAQNEILLHMVQFVIGYLHIIQEEYSQAENIFVNLMHSLKLPQEWPNAAWSSSMLGSLYLQQGNNEEATKYIENCRTIFGSNNSLLGFADVNTYLGFIALNQGNTQQASILLQEGLTLSHQIGTRGHVTYCLGGLACVAITEADFDRAARIFGAAVSLSQRTGVHFDYGLPVLAKISVQKLEELKSLMDEDVFSYVYEEGKRMSIDEAINYALPGTDQRIPTSNE